MSALMSSMKLAAFPIAALVLFLAAFAAIVIGVFGKRASKSMDEASRIPIEDGVVHARTGRAGDETRRAC